MPSLLPLVLSCVSLVFGYRIVGNILYAWTVRQFTVLDELEQLGRSRNGEKL